VKGNDRSLINCFVAADNLTRNPWIRSSRGDYYTATLDTVSQGLWIAL